MMDLYKKRNSNVEWLRIIAMLFIILHHMLSQGFSFCQNPQPSLNLAFLQTFNSLGNFGNKIFIMISGYFLFNSKFSIKKIISVWLELFIYSFGLSLILYIFNIQIYGVLENGFCFTRILQKRDFRLTELAFSAMPFLTGQNWFLTSYLVFLFFVPFLNELISHLDIKKHFLLNILCFFLFNLVQLIPFSDVYVLNNYSSFFQMFFLGSFLKKYPEVFSKKNRKIMFSIGILLPLLYYIFRFLLLNHYHYYDAVPESLYYFLLSAFGYDTLFIISAFCLMAGILAFQERHSILVNLIASSTFGVYLLHNHNYFRRNIWFDFCHLQDHFQKNDFIFHTLISVLLVFIACTLIDFLRKLLLASLCDKLAIKVEETLNKLLSAKKVAESTDV